MITNLFVAYLIATNTFATNVSETLRHDTVYKVIVSSMVIEGETCLNTNRFEIGRHWMQYQTNFVQQPNGLFQKVESWFEVPPRRTMEGLPPPIPAPPPLPGGMMTNVPSQYILLTNYGNLIFTNDVYKNGPRVPP